MVERARIKKCRHAIAGQFHPRKIILFGSYAYGKSTEDSDVDLLVVMNRTRYLGERKSVQIRQAIRLDFPSTCWFGRRISFTNELSGAIRSRRKSSPKAKCCMKPLTRDWVEKAEGDFLRK